jgi:hypothetical protein
MHGWYVIARDSRGETSVSELWTFRSNIPPFAPTHIRPGDNAVIVDHYASFSWSAVDADHDEMVHRVYVATRSDDLSQVAPHCVVATPADCPPLPLARLKTYYWRIDISDGKDTTEGRINSFSVAGIVVS